MTMGLRNDYIRALLTFRGRAAELVAVVLFISLGANLLAASFTLPSGAKSWLGWSPAETLILGLSLTALGVAYGFFRAGAGLPRETVLEGVLVTKRKENEPVEIGGYRFSEKIASFFRGLSENKALANAWRRGSLSAVAFRGDHAVAVGRSACSNLVHEALEYFVLDELSLHLSGHFNNNPRISEEELDRFERADIPSILLQNHFLELFSRPMEEREAFAESGRPPGKKVVFQTAASGAMFDSFDLVLPSNSKVNRLSQDTISIDTTRFTMRISVEFSGFNTVLPRHFEELYLKTKPFSTAVYEVRLRISVAYKVRALFTFKGWEYHRWVDSFLRKLQESFAFDDFIEAIGWNTALTAARILAPAGAGGPGSGRTVVEGSIDLLSADEKAD